VKKVCPYCLHDFENLVWDYSNLDDASCSCGRTSLVLVDGKVKIILTLQKRYIDENRHVGYFSDIGLNDLTVQFFGGSPEDAKITISTKPESNKLIAKAMSEISFKDCDSIYAVCSLIEKKLISLKPMFAFK
jgi:hypothetical protein